MRKPKLPRDRKTISLLISLALFVMACSTNEIKNTRVVFIHHSTGECIWKGNPNRYLYRIFKRGDVERQISGYNRKNKASIIIKEIAFPKQSPYGWKNYPFDYYNIWVDHAGEQPYMEEPTLEILSDKYDVIILKHCYPVSNIGEDSMSSMNMENKTLANYKMQYNALKAKFREFPQTKFLLWTPAARVKTDSITRQEAERTREFYQWVVNEWDDKNDNIFLWDFYSLETAGGLYLKDEFASGPNDSHPGKSFAGRVSKLFANRIIQVTKGVADENKITGEE
jgi:hypothetical protein